MEYCFGAMSWMEHFRSLRMLEKLVFIPVPSQQDFMTYQLQNFALLFENYHNKRFEQLNIYILI